MKQITTAATARAEMHLWLIYAGRKKIAAVRAISDDANDVFDVIFASGAYRTLSMYRDRRSITNLAVSGSIKDGITESAT